MKQLSSKFLFVSFLFFTISITKADTGSFSTLTYNIAGLPEIISSAESDRQSATEQISCYVNEFDFVNVQEDFNYHAALYDTCNNHFYRSPTSGGALFGSGLNTLSRFVYEDWARIKWNNCNGVDCLTPKGFTMARTRLSEGVYVDIYNLHTQAQVGNADLTARRANLLQLASYIQSQSSGNAVIIMGDFNTRYTRSGDNMRELLNRGFTDVWLELVRNGNVPESGSRALTCNPKVTSPDCEIVDKVLYRSNDYVTLTPTLYEIRQDDETNGGLKLSDHPPVQVNWNYTTRSDRKMSHMFGGPHGTAFNDLVLLPENPSVHTVSLRAGRRIDQVALTLDNNYDFRHGGWGGNWQSMTLADGELLNSLYVCSGKNNGRTRIFYAQFNTNHGRQLSGGNRTSNCTTFNAPSGWQIVGFHGRSGNELDKIGVIYAPVPVSQSDRVDYHPLINKDSNLCLSIENGNMNNGSNVVVNSCGDHAWQKWNYDQNSGLIRSEADPNFCLDNTGIFGNGANIIIWTCNGNSHQRFVFNDDGSIGMKTHSVQVIDAYGNREGSTVGTWWNWGGINQRWY